jgi:ABC-type amino acid transport system permease subunit
MNDLTFYERFELNFLKDDRWMYLWNGFCKTILITVVATVISLLIGVTLAII